jgi:hypothetical protein
MYIVLENAIKNSNFKLSVMTNKIDTFWAEGVLNDGERDSLKALMKQYLKPESQAPELLETYRRLEDKYAELEARVSALENNNSGTTEPVEPEEYPEWHPWTGVPGSGYRYGAKVTHKGVKYHSEFNGENVWEPGTLGTEALWVVDA